jgi:hypothetical protein
MSFSIKFTNSFSISKNAFIDECREFSGGMYTHPNKRSLLSKPLLPEFIQLITTHDICIFIETKTDKSDILNIPDGFSYVAKNRKIFKMSFSMKFANSFSISKNASIEEYKEFSGGMYTHPNKRSLLNT